MRFWRGICIGLMIGLMNTIYYSMRNGDGQYYAMGTESTMGRWYYHHLNELQIMIIAVLCWILIGLLFSYAVQIFEEDERGLIQSTVIHYVFCLITFMIIATFAGWTTLKVGMMAEQVIVFSIIYFISWLNYYQRNKKYVERINAQLRHK